MDTKTLFHKIWERHLLESECDGTWNLVKTESLASDATTLDLQRPPSPGRFGVTTKALGWQGAFGALSLRVDAELAQRSEQEGMLVLRKPHVMAVHIMGSLKQRDEARAVEEINRLAFADLEDPQHTVIEYVGPGVAEMDMQTRMRLCQHAVDCGAAAAIMAPDDKTFEFLKPEAQDHRDRTWDLCLKSWRGLFADMFAIYDREAYLNACRI